MPDLYLDFMKPAVWNGLVLAVIFLGVALAILRLMKDRAAYDIRQRRRAMRQESPPEPSPVQPERTPKPITTKSGTRRPKRRDRS